MYYPCFDKRFCHCKCQHLESEAQVLRRILVASNAIQTIDNEMRDNEMR